MVEWGNLQKELQVTKVPCVVVLTGLRWEALFEQHGQRLLPLPSEWWQSRLRAADTFGFTKVPVWGGGKGGKLHPFGFQTYISVLEEAALPLSWLNNWFFIPLTHEWKYSSCVCNDPHTFAVISVNQRGLRLKQQYSCLMINHFRNRGVLLNQCWYGITFSCENK